MRRIFYSKKLTLLFSSVIVLFLVFSAFYAVEDRFDLPRAIFDPSKGVASETEDKEHDFSMADAEENACTKGEKRCVGDIPQRCDTSRIVGSASCEPYYCEATGDWGCGGENSECQNTWKFKGAATDGPVYCNQGEAINKEYDDNGQIIGFDCYDEEAGFSWNNVLANGQGCSDMNKLCLHGECVDFSAVSLLSQPQLENINVLFNRGGIRGNNLSTESMIDEWNRSEVKYNINWDNNPYSSYPYAPDFYYDPDREDTYMATSANKVWAAEDMGPEIAHCPNINDGENRKKHSELPKNNQGFSSCGYSFGSHTHPVTDYGQNCHRNHWQAWGDTSNDSLAVDSNIESINSYKAEDWSPPSSPGIDIGTAYKDCLYNYNNESQFEYILENPYADCDPYNGDTANIDCEAVAQAATQGDYSVKVGNNPGHNPPPVFPNECAAGPDDTGTWDWYEQMPDCTYFEPGDFKRERVCLDKWEDCVPLGEGECPDLDCGGGTISIGNCIYRHINNPCYCPDPPPDGEGIPDTYETSFFSGQDWKKQGYCSWSDGRSAVGTLNESSCDRCDHANDDETCNTAPYENSECSYNECSFHDPNECNCEWNDCQKGYKSCTETSCTDWTCTNEDPYLLDCHDWDYTGSADDLGTNNEMECVDKEYPDGMCDYEECTDIEEETNDDGEVTDTSCNKWDYCAGFDDNMIGCNDWETATDTHGTIISKECVDKEYAGHCDTRECDNMTCVDHEIIWEDMSCESDIEIPEGYDYHEAEDCCTRWSWKCSAGCVSQTEDCYEGQAVNWRSDFSDKYLTFYVGDPSGDCEVSRTHQFTIELLTDRGKTSPQMERLIKEGRDGLYTPHYNYREDELDGKVEEGCSLTSVGDLKSDILASARLVSGDGAGGAGGFDFDFEDYLSDLSGKYIDSIRVESQ